MPGDDFGARQFHNQVQTSSRPSWLALGKVLLIAAAVLAGLIVLIVSGCSGGAEKDQIAFISDRDGDDDVYVMDVDGVEQVLLSNNGARDAHPKWSPDKKILTFVSEESGDREINRVVVNSKEVSSERMTHSPGSDETQYWSPDGRRVAFVSNRDGQPEIYLMGADGSNLTRVTFSPSVPTLSGWSPDGQWIAFTLKGEGEEPGIIARNPDGVNVRRLTGDEDYGAIWSPNGEQMMFTSVRDGNEEIYVMNANGSAQTRLTHNTSGDHSPGWSPDGKSIVYISERDGNPEVYVMKADGASQLRLTYNDVGDESPVWSPDGKRIAFVSYMYGSGEIIAMDADGNHQARLTNNNANDTQPAW